MGAGYHVLAVGRDEIRLREALKDVDQTRVSYLAADLSTVEGPTKVIEEGVKLLPGERLDVLINNAGASRGAGPPTACEALASPTPLVVGPHALHHEPDRRSLRRAGCGVMSQHLGGPSTTLEAYEAMMNLNVRSVYLLTHTAIAHLEKTQGCIINLSSIAGSRPLAGFAAYCMSKAAVELLTKTAALEFAPKRVRVNAIAPATIETDFHARAGACAAAVRQRQPASYAVAGGRGLLSASLPRLA